MRTVDPDPDQLLETLAALPSGVPVTMLNLLRFREVAAYPEGYADLGACSGREAYTERYGPAAFRLVSEVGGEVVWSGEARASLIAPPEEEWDLVLLVRYPSVEAFTTMLAHPDYHPHATAHRTAALLDSRLIATVEGA